MAKVKAVGMLIKDPDGWFNSVTPWRLSMINSEQVLSDLVERMVKSDTVVEVHLDIEFKSEYQEKTHSQLGYMHAAIWPQFYRFYEDQGIPAETKEQKERIRNDVKFAIGFTELVPRILSRAPVEDIDQDNRQEPRSFAGASKEECSEMIERLLVLAADFGIQIEGPEEYKERLDISELT